MCAYRRGVSAPPSLARRIAAASAIHLLWSRVDEHDTEPEAIVDAIANRMKQQFEGFLLLEIKDLEPDPAAAADSRCCRSSASISRRSGLRRKRT
jgi:hypothetical protein